VARFTHIDEGGQAFPSDENDGMTLRDYFAAKAFSLIGVEGLSGGWSEEAATAYAVADAMLEARRLRLKEHD
jgi:hypothetical protein